MYLVWCLTVAMVSVLTRHCAKDSHWWLCQWP